VMDEQSDQQFGNMKWDDDYNRWSATINFAGSNGVRVHIDTIGFEADERIIGQEARRAFTLILESDRKIREMACAELLATYNQIWNQGAHIDAETFMLRLSLQAITIYREGMAEIFFFDDDMFAGHSVVVSLNENGEFDSASIGG